MKRILEAYNRSVFEITPSFIIVTFPYASDFERSESEDSDILDGNLYGNLDGDTVQDNNHVSRTKAILDFCHEPHSRDEIQKFIGVNNRGYFRTSILKPLLQSGEFKMTLPEKPTSRSQKYISS